MTSQTLDLSQFDTRSLQSLADAVFTTWSFCSHPNTDAWLLTLLDAIDEELVSRRRPLLLTHPPVDFLSDDRFDYPSD